VYEKSIQSCEISGKLKKMLKMDQWGKQASAFIPSLVLLVCFYTTTNFRIINGFNIDVPSVITHQGPQGSMFGFSVAQHQDSNVSWYVCVTSGIHSNKKLLYVIVLSVCMYLTHTFNT
jgi:hypothetical protein